MPIPKPLIATVASSVSVLSGALASDAWPQRTVRFILPLGFGSATDEAARLIAEKLSARWGWPVIVENRPGVDGFVATAIFTERHDDHILLFGPSSAFTAHPYRYEDLPYDERDLAPIARVSATLVTVCVPASQRLTSLSELVSLARAQPGKLKWAAMTGAIELIFAGFLKTAGLDMRQVPYYDPVKAVDDVAEGRLHVYQAALGTVRAQAQAGRVKVLAITASQRAAALPDIPTVAEAGFPGLTFDGLVGIYGTRITPAHVRQRIAADVRDVLADPVMLARLTAIGQVAAPGAAAEFAAAIQKQRATLAKTAKVLGLRPATGQLDAADSELV